MAQSDQNSRFLSRPCNCHISLCRSRGAGQKSVHRRRACTKAATGVHELQVGQPRRHSHGVAEFSPARNPGLRPLQLSRSGHWPHSRRPPTSRRAPRARPSGCPLPPTPWARRPDCCPESVSRGRCQAMRRHQWQNHREQRQSFRELCSFRDRTFPHVSSRLARRRTRRHIAPHFWPGIGRHHGVRGSAGPPGHPMLTSPLEWLTGRRGQVPRTRPRRKVTRATRISDLR